MSDKHLECADEDNCLCAETEDHKQMVDKSEVTVRYTESALCDALREIISADHSLVSTIDALWTVKHATLRWNPGEHEKLLDEFLANESKYRTALRRAIREIAQMRHPWMASETTIEFINNIKIAN